MHIYYRVNTDHETWFIHLFIHLFSYSNISKVHCRIHTLHKLRFPSPLFCAASTARTPPRYCSCIYLIAYGLFCCRVFCCRVRCACACDLLIFCTPHKLSFPVFSFCAASTAPIPPRYCSCIYLTTTHRRFIIQRGHEHTRTGN